MRKLVASGKTHTVGFSTLEVTFYDDPDWHPQTRPGDEEAVDDDLVRKIALESSED